jgi:phosphomannomutase
VLKRELLASGLVAIDVGIVHTPALYFSVSHLRRTA